MKTSILLLAATLPLAACSTLTGTSNVARCEGACTTHEEGYQWAQGANLLDTTECRDYPQAFLEGCRDGVEDLFQLRRATRSTF
jgi:hypothetical protein